MSAGLFFFFQICFEQPLSRHLLNAFRNGIVSLEMCGVKMLSRRVRHSVFPTCEYHSEVKSLYYPLKIGRKPRNSFLVPSSSVPVKSKLMIRTITPMLMNCRMVNFIN